VYVGGHYPLDVLGGILLRVGVSLIFIGLENRIESIIIPIKNILRRFLKTLPENGSLFS
jgi:membrane-associated phospholipid phosphatase